MNIVLCGIGGIMMQFDSVTKVGFDIVAIVGGTIVVAGGANSLVKKLNG